MKQHHTLLYAAVMLIAVLSGTVAAAGPGFDDIYEPVANGISATRAYEYVSRIWQYDKWCTLPMWNRSAREVQTIMNERGFDEALVIPTPADGVTTYGDWTNPIGWDCTGATLEVIEPAGLPEDVRFLANYKINPSALTFFAEPTPEGGLVAELAVLDDPSENGLRTMNPRGKILLTNRNAGGLKRHLDDYGVPGIVYDRAVGPYEDANVWHNTWSDVPGGWLMTAKDSQKGFCFSISKQKGDYLRSLLAEGTTVKVRAVIDSRFYTDGNLPYVVGAVKGADPEAGEVLIGGHLFEWGAGDNASGCAIMLESVGTLNYLIEQGVLPRPRRTIRVWMGQEMYGSLPFAERYLENLRNTVAAVICDTPAPPYDQISSTVKVFENPALSPTYTDAVYTWFFEEYYRRIGSNKLFINAPFEGGTDTYFCEPLIGAPTNFVYMENGTYLHHNSRDTLEMIDTRSLRDLCMVNALYLYYMADAGSDNVDEIAHLTADWGMRTILDYARDMRNRIPSAGDGAALGRLLYDGTRQIDFRTGLQEQAVMSILRLTGDTGENDAETTLKRYRDDIADYGRLIRGQFEEAVKAAAKKRDVHIVTYKPPRGEWEREASRIVPKALKLGTLTLESIPPEEWQPVTRSPKWWSNRNWPAAAYWWSDGTRTLAEIRDTIELAAVRPVEGIDLIDYFRLLEKYGLVELAGK